MKKILMSRIFIFVLGLVIAGSVGVYAAIKIQADEIGYHDGTVSDALNNLYSKTNGSKKTCLYVSGTKGAVSSKYLCDLGDGIARYFYVLKTDGNQVKLIMEKNLSDEVGNATMTWNDAMTFFDEGHDGYSTKLAWKNVSSIDLPSAQDIADAGGITGFDVASTSEWSYFGVNSTADSSKRANYTWLYNYTKACILYNCLIELPDSNGVPYGYWTKNLIYNDKTNAWSVNRDGKLGTTNVSNDIYRGVRPVITISTGQLSN